MYLLVDILRRASKQNSFRIGRLRSRCKSGCANRRSRFAFFLTRTCRLSHLQSATLPERSQRQSFRGATICRLRRAVPGRGTRAPESLQGRHNPNSALLKSAVPPGLSFLGSPLPALPCRATDCIVASRLFAGLARRTHQGLSAGNRGGAGSSASPQEVKAKLQSLLARPRNGCVFGFYSVNPAWFWNRFVLEPLRPRTPLRSALS
jgi:hypothetical protein